MTAADVIGVRDSLINHISAEFNRLIAMMEITDSAAILDRTIPITADPIIFKHKKPIAVLFGTEQVDAPSWKMAYSIILSRCNQDAKCHEHLMSLRGRVGGSVRVFLTDSPDGMRNPIKIDDDLYAEASYGAQGVMQILTNRMLAPVRYDYSGISVIVREPKGTAPKVNAPEVSG
jgi:hypothetical protein